MLMSMEVDYGMSVILYRYGDHRDLDLLTHSFPTRRSADLRRDRVSRACSESLRTSSLPMVVICRTDRSNSGLCTSKARNDPANSRATAFRRAAAFASRVKSSL